MTFSKWPPLSVRSCLTLAGYRCAWGRPHLEGGLPRHAGRPSLGLRAAHPCAARVSGGPLRGTADAVEGIAAKVKHERAHSSCPLANRYNRAMSTSPLIDATGLAARLRDPDWVVVDCRFNLLDPAAGKAAYLRAHIPGARYADLDRDLARRPGPADGRHPLPDRAALAARLGEWGIAESSTVVAYDDGSGAIAARLWWLLRWLGHDASLVLDGGFAAWTAAGLPTESDVPAWQPARFTPRAAAASRSQSIRSRATCRARSTARSRPTSRLTAGFGRPRSSSASSRRCSTGGRRNS